jgi:DNA invertase Pin-like site-specific DNA recombinase
LLLKPHLPREAERRELLKLLKALEHGDVVTVTRIDRLARSTFDLFAIVKRIVDAGAQFRSLAESSTCSPTLSAPWCLHTRMGPHRAA